jgi:hypothetical protein
MGEVSLLPAPKRHRERFLAPIALYGSEAWLLLPADMTEAEANKIAAVVKAYSTITPYNAT